MIVKYKAKNIFRVRYQNAKGEVVRLNIVPGVNVIDDDQWEDIQKHPTVATMLEADVLEFEDKPFSQLGEKEATRIVKNTNDEKVLELWAGKEKREKVKIAITERLKVIAEYAQNQGGKKKE